MKKLIFMVSGVVALAGVALAVPHPSGAPAIDYADEPPLPDRLAYSWVPEQIDPEWLNPKPVEPVAHPSGTYAIGYTPAPGYVNYYTLLRVRINRDR